MELSNRPVMIINVPKCQQRTSREFIIGQHHVLAMPCVPVTSILNSFNANYNNSHANRINYNDSRFKFLIKRPFQWISTCLVWNWWYSINKFLSRSTAFLVTHWAHWAQSVQRKFVDSVSNLALKGLILIYCFLVVSRLIFHNLCAESTMDKIIQSSLLYRNMKYKCIDNKVAPTFYIYIFWP